MRKLVVLCVVLSLSCSAFAALTGLTTDVMEPAWRGMAGTTLQGWSFDTGDNPALLDPSLDMNPYGTPSAEVFTPDTGFPRQTYWMDSDGGHDGVWRLYGDDYLMLHIPNTDNTGPNTSKEIWLQITYSAGSIERKPQLQTLPNYASLEHIQGTVVDDLYYHDIFKITLEPNPTEEWIAIMPRDCTLYIDEIVVDTVCVPEPATLLVLSLGGLVALRKRK